MSYKDVNSPSSGKCIRALVIALQTQIRKVYPKLSNKCYGNPQDSIPSLFSLSLLIAISEYKVTMYDEDVSGVGGVGGRGSHRGCGRGRHRRRRRRHSSCGGRWWTVVDGGGR